jgi:hypothetical protein
MVRGDMGSLLNGQPIRPERYGAALKCAPRASRHQQSMLAPRSKSRCMIIRIIEVCYRVAWCRSLVRMSAFAVYPAKRAFRYCHSALTMAETKGSIFPARALKLRGTPAQVACEDCGRVTGANGRPFKENLPLVVSLISKSNFLVIRSQSELSGPISGPGLLS